jgi:flagellar basal-body rod modification protein FlgD
MSLTEGASLIGKEVTYYEPVTETQLTGTVEGLQVAGGRVYLQIGDYAIPMEYVMEVTESKSA